MYHEGQRELQNRFDSTRLADRLEEVKVHASLTEADQRFIGERDMFFLATADRDGNPTCSYKGGDPGFVMVVDPETIAFPCYDGNGMFLSMGNVVVNPSVGLLFIDFERQRRMRMEGVATIEDDDPLRTRWPGAQLVVRVRVTRVYPNCPRYIHHYALVERSTFVPRAGSEPPVPDWKRSDWACDVLPAGDPARHDR